jgi:hypothetical protein
MIAYNNDWLDNLLIQHEVENACHENFISKDELIASQKKYPSDFYSPNIFMRTGLFVLTFIIAGFSLGLISLIFLSAINENGFGILIFIFGLICYNGLEFMVKQKHHYKSGVDDALMWTSGSCVIAGLNLVINISPTANALIIFIISSYLLLRFANALMAVIVTFALLSFVFLVYTKLGVFAKATISFLLLISATAIYFFIKKLSEKIQYRHYKNAFMLIKVTVLICMYTAVNYFVVREISITMFNLELKAGDNIPLGWLFWFFTVVIPCLYILRGLQKKDTVVLRVGLLLVAAIVFTVRYYHTILPIEVAMTVIGLILIGIAYVVTQYLKEPKYGFTFSAGIDRDLLDKINIEAVVIAETFTAVQPIDNKTGFGGGSFGGGGATGDF